MPYLLYRYDLGQSSLVDIYKYAVYVYVSVLPIICMRVFDNISPLTLWQCVCPFVIATPLRRLSGTIFSHYKGMHYFLTDVRSYRYLSNASPMRNVLFFLIASVPLH